MPKVFFHVDDLFLLVSDDVIDLLLVVVLEKIFMITSSHILRSSDSSANTCFFEISPLIRTYLEG